MHNKILQEEEDVEKIPYPKDESLKQFFIDLYNVGLKRIYSALYSAFADPIILLSRLFWSNSIDRGIRPKAGWFERFPTHPNGKAVLLCHGFATTPETYLESAELFVEAGYYVRAIRLSGHGTSLGHFAKTSATEWLASVVWHYKAIQDDYEDIYYIGHSLGGTLGLLLATIYPICKVAVMAAPIKLIIPPAKFVREASIIVKYWPRSRKRRLWIDEHGFSAYKKTPLYAVGGIFDAGKALRSRADKLTCPVFYIKAGLDHKSLQPQLDFFKQYFPNTPLKEKIAEKSPHAMYTGPEKDEIFQEIIDWISED